MHQVNQCSGFFVKQKQKAQKAFKIYYFYVTADGEMFYMHNMAYLNFLVRNSQHEKELVNRLKASNFDCRISGVKSFPAYDSVPFHQRSCFELQVTYQQSIKSVIVFSTVEEDIEQLQDFLKGGWQKRKVQQDQRALYIDQEFEVHEKVLLLSKIQQIFEHTSKIPAQIIGNGSDSKCDVNDEVTYTGQVHQDKPEGTGTLIFKHEGMSFVGEFKDGMKHGSGYIVDSNLDIIYCEVINDELSGI